MLNELILMRPSFFSKRQAKRDHIEKEATTMDKIIKENADDLETQFKRVFSVSGKTAKIKIVGPLSQEGPDWIDVYLGYGGTAYKNIVRAAMEAKSLFEDGKIENVIVKMNTGGGYLDGLDFAYQALQGISEIGEIINEGVIASAGVWLASAFSKIYPATDSAQIGSIGVGVTYFEDSQYFSNFGIERVDITNTKSPNKWPDVLTKEGVSIIRRELDDLYNVFVSKVTAARPITKKDIDSLKGEMLISSKAISFGLMDKPQNGKIPIDAEMENKNKETEASRMPEVKKITDVEPAVIIDLVTPAVEAERVRIYGLAKISGVEISEELKTAINTGVEVGKFAVMQIEAREAKENAEVEAARKLRETNPNQAITGIDADTLGTKKIDKLDKMLDENFEKKGGKK